MKKIPNLSMQEREAIGMAESFARHLAKLSIMNNFEIELVLQAMEFYKPSTADLPCDREAYKMLTDMLKMLFKSDNEGNVVL